MRPEQPWVQPDAADPFRNEARTLAGGHAVSGAAMLSNAIRGHMAELGIISAKGRKGTAELIKIIGRADDDRVPAAARFSLDVLARQYEAIWCPLPN